MSSHPSLTQSAALRDGLSGNLDTIRDWLRRSENGPEFRKLQPRLAAAQDEGFTLRRSGKFRSRLPR